MLLSKRSVLGLVAITTVLAGCGTTTVVQGAASSDEPTTGGSSGSGGGSSSSPDGGAGSAEKTLSFGTPAPYDASKNPVTLMRTFDFDGDGHLDIAVASSSYAVGVMRNLGDGTFADIVWKSRRSLGDIVLAVGDLDGDGRGDLVLTAPVASGDAMLDVIHGAADGSVADPAPWGLAPYTGSPAGPLQFADLNGDGTPDLVQCSTDSVSIWMLTSNGSVASATRTSRTTLRNCAAGDLNADGRVDLVTGDGSSSIGANLTDANGALPKVSTLYKAPEDDSYSLTGLFSADVNGDGRADLIATFSGDVSVQLSNADGSLAEPLLSRGKLAAPYRDNGVYAKFADLNGDGHLDIVMAGGGSGSKGNVVAIMLGDGAGHFTQATIDLGLLGDGPASDIAVGDFDGDGLPDIAVAFGERNYVLRNTTH